MCKFFSQLRREIKNSGYKAWVNQEAIIFHKESRSAKHYANLLNISYKELNNLTKVFTESTAKDYINDYTILEAKRSLASTNLSIKEIAFDYGFKEATNFIKFFLIDMKVEKFYS